MTLKFPLIFHACKKTVELLRIHVATRSWATLRPMRKHQSAYFNAEYLRRATGLVVDICAFTMKKCLVQLYTFDCPLRGRHRNMLPPYLRYHRRCLSWKAPVMTHHVMVVRGLHFGRAPRAGSGNFEKLLERIFEQVFGVSVFLERRLSWWTVLHTGASSEIPSLQFFANLLPQTTCLLLAAQTGDVDTGRPFLESGADPLICKLDGLPPADLARPRSVTWTLRRGRAEIRKMVEHTCFHDWSRVFAQLASVFLWLDVALSTLCALGPLRHWGLRRLCVSESHRQLDLMHSSSLVQHGLAELSPASTGRA